MKRLILILIAILAIANLFGQPKRIYIAPDDHTDYMWSSTEEGYKQAFLETLDYYIKLNDSTANTIPILIRVNGIAMVPTGFIPTRKTAARNSLIISLSKLKKRRSLFR